jgi:hypothetical protein
MMAQQSAPKSSWYYAMAMVLKLDELLPTRMKEKAPISAHERAVGQRPLFKNIFLFWSPVRFLIDPKKREDKFDIAADAGRYLGPDGQNPAAVLIWDNYKVHSIIGSFRINEVKAIDHSAKARHMEQSPMQEALDGTVEAARQQQLHDAGAAASESAPDDKTSSAPPPLQQDRTLRPRDQAGQATACKPSAVSSKPDLTATKTAPAAKPKELVIVPPHVYPNETCKEDAGWLAEVTGKDGARRRLRFVHAGGKPVWLHESVLQPAPAGSACTALQQQVTPQPLSSTEHFELAICAPLWQAAYACSTAGVKPNAGGFHICAGDTHRQGCFSKVASRMGLPCRDFEKEESLGGGTHGDLFVDATFCSALAEIKAGMVGYMVGGPPCTTGTSVRFLAKSVDEHGPPVLRRQSDPDGDACPVEWRMEVTKSNALNRRVAALAMAVLDQGGFIVLETPACQGEGAEAHVYDPRFKEHCTVLMSSPFAPVIARLKKVTCSFCKYGAPSKKPIDLYISPELTELIEDAQQRQCDHGPAGHTAPLTSDEALRSSQEWPSEFSVSAVKSIKAARLRMQQASQVSAASVMRDTRTRQVCASMIEWMGSVGESDVLEIRNFCELPRRDSRAIVAMQDLAPDMSNDESFDPDATNALDEEHVAVAIIDGKINFTVATDMCMVTMQSGRTSLLAGPELKSPSNEKEFKNSPHKGIWQASREVEVEAWRAIPVFTPMPLSEVRNKFGNVRIHRMKFVDYIKANKTTGKGEARSRGVIVGTTMEEGKDHYSTYSACARVMGFKLTMISVLTKMHHGWVPLYVDLKQAHQHTKVNGRLPREMFCHPLPGFGAKEGEPPVVWLMHTCAQGSPPAARLFSEDVVETLRNGGFHQSFNDDAMFMKGDQRGVGAELAMWVDDFCGGAHIDVIDEVERIFRTRWPDATIYRDWRNILGNDVVVDMDNGSASLNFSKSIGKLCESVFGDVVPPRTTLPYTARIATLTASPEPDTSSPDRAEWLARQKRVRSGVGKMVHLSQWLPDIVYAVSKLAGVMAAPTEHAEEEMKATVAYLYHRMHIELNMGGKHIVSLDAVEPLVRHYTEGMTMPTGPFAFADGALGEVDSDGKSMSGVLIVVGHTPMLTISARQHCVAKDSHDTEIYAASLCVSMQGAVRDILREKGWLMNFPSYIFIDSASTLAVVESVNRLHRSLHLARRVFMMRMAESEGEANFAQTAGVINKSDPFTKAVPRAVFLAARTFWYGKM